MTIDPNSAGQFPRRFLPLALKIAGGHLVLIAVILIPLVIHENRQAERDWVKFTEYWEAQGEVFNFKDLIPLKIPDKDNFASSPIIAELFDQGTPNRVEKFI